MPVQSIKSNDRFLADWYSKIKKGEIKLPRFQRQEAWDRKRIAGFLTVIVNNLPVGITLILNVDKPQFIDRFLETAPDGGGRVQEHLLDGQQRLTAFWRSVNNNYISETYFIQVPQLIENRREDGESSITGYYQPRWTKEGKRYPVWANNPSEVLSRGLIPCNLLMPGDNGTLVKDWITLALADQMPSDSDPDVLPHTKRYYKRFEEIDKAITVLRETVSYYNLPFLALPADTPKSVALDVFIKMNTNSKPLSLYDVIVAEVENVNGQSLHSLSHNINLKVPSAHLYSDLGGLILAVSALLQDKIPNERGQIEMNKKTMVENWVKLEKGIQMMVTFLESLHIYDAQRLPTNAVLGVVGALFAEIPLTGDERGAAELVLKKYLWHSFFSDRYENSTNSRAFQDYKNMKIVIQKIIAQPDVAINLSEVPIFTEDYPLVTPEELMSIKWPKGENVKGRGILAVANLLGACDFADGTKISRETLPKREYHHIYPVALVNEAGLNPHLALNCVLITDKTNRTIGRKEPLQYLKERYNSWSNETIVNQRLNSHLVPFAELQAGSYEDLSDADFKKQFPIDYSDFLQRRSRLIHEAVIRLANGEAIEAESIIQAEAISHQNKQAFRKRLEDRLESLRAEASESDNI